MATQYWVLVLVPFGDFHHGNSLEALEKIKEIGQWTIGARSRYKERLAKGDKAVIYSAGDEKAFVGSLAISSSLIDEKAGYSVKIERLNIWHARPKITDLLDKLTFIKNKKSYGVYLIGGLVPIPESDFKLIIESAK
jgi:predicted RNA-binding protein